MSILEWAKKEVALANQQDGTTTSTENEDTMDDYDREYCIDVNDEHEIPLSTGLATMLIHELYPISLPYIPSTKKFLVYMDRFLTDVNYGDYDTVAILGIRTLEGDKLDIKRYYKDTDDGMVEITEQEFLSRKQRSLSPDQIELERAARRVVRIYIKVCYDSEKSLFRVSAFEYENSSQVNADEVLHPHLNSGTKS